MELHERLKAARGRSPTQAEVAERFGISTQAVSQWESGSTAPGRDRLPALAELYGVRLEWLMNGTGPRELQPGDIKNGLTNPRHNDERSVIMPNEIHRAEGAHAVPQVNLWPQDVPIYGTAVGGESSGEFYFNGELAGRARRPPVLADVMNAFAIYLSNDSMKPVFKPGRRVYIDPNRPALPGDYVLVEVHATGGDSNGPAYLKQLVRRTAKDLFLRQLNPPKDLPPLPMTSIKHLYRAIEPDEWLGE